MELRISCTNASICRPIALVKPRRNNVVSRKYLTGASQCCWYGCQFQSNRTTDIKSDIYISVLQNFVRSFQKIDVLMRLIAYRIDTKPNRHPGLLTNDFTPLTALTTCTFITKMRYRNQDSASNLMSYNASRFLDLSNEGGWWPNMSAHKLKSCH